MFIFLNVSVGVVLALGKLDDDNVDQGLSIVAGLT